MHLLSKWNCFLWIRTIIKPKVHMNWTLLEKRHSLWRTNATWHLWLPLHNLGHHHHGSPKTFIIAHTKFVHYISLFTKLCTHINHMGSIDSWNTLVTLMLITFLIKLFKGKKEKIPWKWKEVKNIFEIFYFFIWNKSWKLINYSIDMVKRPLSNCIL
jgi:hypothetical protein